MQSFIENVSPTRWNQIVFKISVTNKLNWFSSSPFSFSLSLSLCLVHYSMLFAKILKVIELFSPLSLLFFYVRVMRQIERTEMTHTHDSQDIPMSQLTQLITIKATATIMLIILYTLQKASKILTLERDMSEKFHCRVN